MLAAGLLALAGCRINGSGEPEAYFRVEADSSLAACDRVVVILADSARNRIDTLFDDSLASPGDLDRLPAGSYRGGPALITVLGYRDGKLVSGETRVYDGDRQQTLALVVLAKDTSGAAPGTGSQGTGSGPGSGGTDTVPVVSTPTSHAPFVDSISRDTIVSIRDVAPLAARLNDPDGDLKGYSWNCGAKTDSQAAGGPRFHAVARPAFPDSGNHSCLLEIWDAAGHVAHARVGIRVELDPPTADAGKDTTVAVGTLIRLHARGNDRFGSIVSRAWRLGDGPFLPIPYMETTQKASDTPGPMVFTLRVTDSDSLSAYDTLVVTVEASLK